MTKIIVANGHKYAIVCQNEFSITVMREAAPGKFVKANMLPKTVKDEVEKIKANCK